MPHLIEQQQQASGLARTGRGVSGEQLLDQRTGGRQPSPLERVAGGIQKGVTSFLTGIPQIELDEREAGIALSQAQTGRIEQQAEGERVEAQRELQLQNLSRLAFSDDPNADQALQEIFALDPEKANTIFESIGVRTQAERDDTARRAAEIRGNPPEKRRSVIMRQASELSAQGRDPRDTLSLLDLTPEDQDNQLRVIEAAALSTQQRAQQQRIGGATAATRTSEAIAQAGGFSPEERIQAARIEAGLDPRATGSAAITTATTEGLTEQVAESEATIKQRTKFAELTGASRAKTIDKGVETIQKINQNILNLDKAIAAIDQGATSGVIENRFSPTIRESTLKLQQIQKQLGLDVVGAASFGALSAGELDLALKTALPTDLQPPALRQWIVDRKAAQTKLLDYFADQVDFLDQGGSIAGFLRQERRRVSGRDAAEAPIDGAEIPAQQPTGTGAQFLGFE